MAAVAGFLNVALNTISNVLTVSEVGLMIWLFSGGWMWSVRKIGFFLDCKLVNFISYAYNYFNMILNGTMFNEEVTDAILGNIYIFIGVIVFFRLMMLVIKYLVNPDLVNDAKVGVNALIQRVIIGCCGILFIPTIFDIAFDLQDAILNDQIIQQIIIPHDIIETVSDKIESGGKYIGTYVLSGFVNPSSSASSKTTNEYEVALSKGDLSSISINRGGWMANEESYEYEYFFLISTFVLFYVFYQMLKYTIDVAVRAFKMLIYQILAPVAMVEYMINGSDDGVFKNWRTAVLSTYCMIFVRVMAVWFVVFVTLIMSGDLPGYAEGSLLATDDYLLRAIIIIALLGFMMDLPKIIGQIFGLDLEQEGSATGLLKQVGGMIKGAAIGALAVGGAAAGSAIGGVSKLSEASKNANAQTKAKQLAGGFGDKKGQELKDAMKADRTANFQSNLKDLDKGGMVRGAVGGIASAALGSNQFTGAFANSYSQNKKAQEQTGDNAYAVATKKQKERERENWLHDKPTDDDIRKETERQEVVRDITERVIESSPKDATQKEIQARVNAQLYGQPSEMTATINGKLNAITNAGGTIDAGTVTQQVQQVLSQKIDVTPQEVEQRVNQVLANGGSLSTPQDVEQVVSQVVNQTIGDRVQSESQTVTQTVNQVYGTRVGTGDVASVTQEVNQTLKQSVDVQRNIQTNTEQSVDIQRNIETNTSDAAVWAEVNAENTERASQDLGEIKRDTHNIDSKM